MAKEEAKNSVSAATVPPHWKASELSKEQYEKINRDISRKLYEIGADRSLTDERNRCALEKIATEKVATTWTTAIIGKSVKAIVLEAHPL
jgi:hypothetical protein